MIRIVIQKRILAKSPEGRRGDHQRKGLRPMIDFEGVQAGIGVTNGQCQQETQFHLHAIGSFDISFTFITAGSFFYKRGLNTDEVRINLNSAKVNAFFWNFYENPNNQSCITT